jgi:hypothetical protein
MYRATDLGQIFWEWDWVPNDIKFSWGWGSSRTCINQRRYILAGSSYKGQHSPFSVKPTTWIVTSLLVYLPSLKETIIPAGIFFASFGCLIGGFFFCWGTLGFPKMEVHISDATGSAPSLCITGESMRETPF